MKGRPFTNKKTKASFLLSGQSDAVACKLAQALLDVVTKQGIKQFRQVLWKKRDCSNDSWIFCLKSKDTIPYSVWYSKVQVACDQVPECEGNFEAIKASFSCVDVENREYDLWECKERLKGGNVDIFELSDDNPAKKPRLVYQSTFSPQTIDADSAIPSMPAATKSMAGKGIFLNPDITKHNTSFESEISLSQSHQGLETLAHIACNSLFSSHESMPSAPPSSIDEGAPPKLAAGIDIERVTEWQSAPVDELAELESRWDVDYRSGRELVRMRLLRVEKALRDRLGQTSPAAQDSTGSIEQGVLRQIAESTNRIWVYVGGAESGGDDGGARLKRIVEDLVGRAAAAAFGDRAKGVQVECILPSRRATELQAGSGLPFERALELYLVTSPDLLPLAERLVNTVEHVIADLDSSSPASPPRLRELLEAWTSAKSAVDWGKLKVSFDSCRGICRQVEHQVKITSMCPVLVDDGSLAQPAVRRCFDRLLQTVVLRTVGACGARLTAPQQLPISGHHSPSCCELALADGQLVLSFRVQGVSRPDARAALEEALGASSLLQCALSARVLVMVRPAFLSAAATADTTVSTPETLPTYVLRIDHPSGAADVDLARGDESHPEQEAAKASADEGLAGFAVNLLFLFELSGGGVVTRARVPMWLADHLFDCLVCEGCQGQDLPVPSIRLLPRDGASPNQPDRGLKRAGHIATGEPETVQWSAVHSPDMVVFDESRSNSSSAFVSAKTGTCPACAKRGLVTFHSEFCGSSPNLSRLSRPVATYIMGGCGCHIIVCSACAAGRLYDGEETLYAHLRIEAHVAGATGCMNEEDYAGAADVAECRPTGLNGAGSGATFDASGDVEQPPRENQHTDHSSHLAESSSRPLRDSEGSSSRRFQPVGNGVGSLVSGPRDSVALKTEPASRCPLAAMGPDGIGPATGDVEGEQIQAIVERLRNQFASFRPPPLLASSPSLEHPSPNHTSPIQVATDDKAGETGDQPQSNQAGQVQCGEPSEIVQSDDSNLKIMPSKIKKTKASFLLSGQSDAVACKLAQALLDVKTRRGNPVFWQVLWKKRDRSNDSWIFCLKSKDTIPYSVWYSKVQMACDQVPECEGHFEAIKASLALPHHLNREYNLWQRFGRGDDSIFKLSEDTNVEVRADD